MSIARGGRATRTSRTGEARERLLRQVVEANGDLQDVMDVAATIESLGWSDRRVEDVFGMPSVFDLAEDIYADFLASVRTDPIPPRHDMRWYHLLRLIAADFFHGLLFALPMVVSIAAMVMLHISIWSYQYYSVAQATALGIATFLSFVVTGGFTQAMATIYYVLVGLQEGDLVERSLYQIMRWGFGAAVVIAIAIVVADSVFPMFPFSLAFFMVVYMIMLSLLWLAYASLYVLRREYMLTLLTVGSILIAYFMWRFGHNVILAQAMAMAAATGGAVLSWLVIFRRQTRKWQHIGRIVKTRTSQLAYASASYFFYGILYFSFVFSDRLVAWTTATSFLPYSIWFRGEYELGMDWALFALILPLGATEAFVGYVIRWLMVAQHRVTERNVQNLAAAMRAVYLRCVAGFVGVAAIGMVMVRIGLAIARQYPILRNAIPIHGVEPFVFSWASFAYVVLALALFNVLLMFSLAYPQLALRSLLISLAADITVGIIATRILGAYQFAVVGLIAGVICLVVLTTVDVLRLLPRVDFMLYRMA